jgi:hypothetical protein
VRQARSAEAVELAIWMRSRFSHVTWLAGSGRRLNTRNSISVVSTDRMRPMSGSPRPRSTLIVSSAWIDPMMPGSTPSTPASAQLGASSAGGGSGTMSR